MKKYVVPFILVLVFGGLTFMRLETLKGQETEVAVERPPMSVAVAEIKRGPVRQLVLGEGTARAVRHEYLSFTKAGTVTSVARDADDLPLREGSRVRGPAEGERLGQLLAQLDIREDRGTYSIAEANLSKARQQVQATRADIEQAKADLAVAKRNMERNSKLLSQGFLSESEFEKSKAEYEAARTKVLAAESSQGRAQADVKALASELGKARVGLERTGLYAPFDGLVAFLNIQEGDQISPASLEGMSEEQKAKAAHIVVVDPSRFEITLHLAPSDARQIKQGQQCVVYRSLRELVQGFSGSDAIPATVYSVSPALTPGERLVQVKLRTTAPAQGLTDGMYVTAWIVVEEKDDAVLVPSSALVLRDNKPLVYVVDKAASTVELREVAFGLLGISEYEAASGLKEGEVVVVQGKHRLADGVKVAITPAR